MHQPGAAPSSMTCSLELICPFTRVFWAKLITLLPCNEREHTVTASDGLYTDGRDEGHQWPGDFIPSSAALLGHAKCMLLLWQGTCTLAPFRMYSDCVRVPGLWETGPTNILVPCICSLVLQKDNARHDMHA